MGRRQRANMQAAMALLALLVSLALPAHPREDSVPALSTDQIVQKLLAANAYRAEALRGFRGKRSYTVEYHGFPGGRSADMSVDAAYIAPDKKEFSIVSQNGSKLLLTRVLQRLLDSEKEAMREDSRHDTELSPRNYEFSLVGTEHTAEGSAYILEVKPRKNYKFLYRGKIWVDAQDFAVQRMEGEPAKNPSFWISRTSIEQRYGKFGEFWLPVHNRSVTKVRLGGEAVLNISYTDYEINGARQEESRNPRGIPASPKAQAGEFSLSRQ